MRIINKIKIRRAKKEDLEKIYLLGRRIKEFTGSEQTRFYGKKELREFLEKPESNILLVSISDNKIIGFIYAKLITNYWCMIDNIGVSIKYINQGIGTMLLEELYKILKYKNIKYLQAFVGEEYKKTRNFWNKQGFQEGKKFIWIEKNL